MKLAIESNEPYRPLWQSSKRYVIIMGGRGAGRSFETSQKIGASLIQTKRPFRAAIMRAVHTDIRHSIWQELQDRVRDWEIGSTIRIADSTMEMEHGRNSVHAHGFRKSSSERTAKLKSLAGYTDAFIEEAEEVGKDEFQQLDDSLRSEGSQIHLLLNTPSRSHWVIERWFNIEPSEAPGFYEIALKPGVADVEFIHTDHRSNPYLDESVHERYEAYRKTNPAYYWQMIRGLSPEVVMGRIYTGWKEIEEIPHEARFLGRGEDFGFAHDPDAIVDIYYHNGGYILDEVHYATGNDHDALIAINKMLKPAPAIVGDAADARMIATLRKAGIGIMESDKGAGSVEHGIRHVQGLRISYTSRSVNLKREYENYAWLITKDGDEKNAPDPKCADHCFAGDTLIHTTSGMQRIDGLVGKEGFLYSREGRIQRFHSVRLTRRNADTLTIHFKDKTYLTVTPDHLLLRPDGMWIEAQLLRPMDMIQSAMYGRDYPIFHSAVVWWQDVLQAGRVFWTQWSAFASRRMGISQWSYSYGYAHSSQRPQSTQQPNRQPGTKNPARTSHSSHESRTTRTRETTRKSYSSTHQAMALVRKGKGVAQVSWKENNAEPSSLSETLRSLPYGFYNKTIRQIGAFLSLKLQNERASKTVERVARGRAEVTFNLEVDGTHCLVANGVVAHNCLDGARYFLVKMVQAGADPDDEVRQVRVIHRNRRNAVDAVKRDVGL